jgi:hypothetical protein
MSDPMEPCFSCGEDTGVGSVFFSDRHTVEPSARPPTYLCTLCNSRVRLSGRGKRLTDEQVRQFVANGTMAGIAWSGRGPV